MCLRAACDIQQAARVFRFCFDVFGPPTVSRGVRGFSGLGFMILDLSLFLDSKLKMKRNFLLASLLVVSCVLGCSEGLKEFPCAEASGTVLCEGLPVQGAQVYFSPKMTGKSAEVGKPGFGITDIAGRFALSTYGNQDGAVVGSHVVRVTTSNEFPCDCVGEETMNLMDVEIVADKTNEFEIKLPSRTAPPKVNPFDDAESAEDAEME